MAETKTFEWTLKGKTVEVEMLAADFDEMTARAKRVTTGAEARELALLADIFATFPGTTIERPPTAKGVPPRPAPKRRPPEAAFTTGRYHGRDATPTEEESGLAVEVENFGPLKPDGPGHLMLLEFGTGDRMTSYEASFRSTANHHAIRREITRLVERGFVRTEGEMPNPAPRGRGNVHAYRITERGRAELYRLRQPVAR